jgi:hypothetical protein
MNQLRKVRSTTQSTKILNRLQVSKGPDVASATTITLGDANYFDITGTTTVTYITTTGWDPGAIVTLQFDGSVTVTHNGGSPVAGTSAAILLAGAGNLSATASDTLTLVYDGTTWRQLAVSAI